MAEVVITKRTYYVVFGLLMGLLVLTIVLAFAHLGPFELLAAYTIAAVKALLIILYFMHVRKSSRLTWAFAGSAFVWLGILLVLTMGDYLTRGWLPSSERLSSRKHIPPPPAVRRHRIDSGIDVNQGSTKLRDLWGPNHDR